MSVGIERVFAILKAKGQENTRATETQVYVIGLGDISVPVRLGIMKELWDAGINVILVVAIVLIGRRSSSINLNLRITRNSSSWRRRVKR
jgi:histidyl-tRNA synthetase